MKVGTFFRRCLIGEFLAEDTQSTIQMVKVECRDVNIISALILEYPAVINDTLLATMDVTHSHVR